MKLLPRLHPKERELIEVVAVPLAVTIGVGVATSSMLVAFLTVGLFWFAPAWIAAEVAMKKDRGRWWGFFLGWLGVVIAAAIGPGRSSEMNQLEAKALELQIRELEQRHAELRR